MRHDEKQVGDEQLASCFDHLPTTAGGTAPST
jgi:hypothetical protein